MNKRLLSITLAILSFLQYNLIMAQTGPAGIGNKDGDNGQPKNLFWLDAASITASDGDVVNQWSDKSGNNITFEESNYANVESPRFISNAINNLPAVSFRNSYDNRGSAIVKRNFSNFPRTNISTFIVYRTEPGENEDGILSYAVGGGSYSNEYLLFNSTSIRTYIKSRNANSPLGSNDGNYHILSNRWSTLKGVYVSIDGQSGYVNTHTNFKNKTIQQNGCLAIGGEQDNIDANYVKSQALDGDIAEVIVYDAFLNDAQKTIIENYLNNKYGITIDNDYFAAANNYSYDFAGIGQESNGNQTSAKSGNTGFYVKAVNDLNDSEYIMFAHNNSANSVSNADCPATVQERWAKDWNVQVTGSVGAKITFDLPEGISGYKPQNIQNYVLLYRSSTSGTYSIVPASVNFGDVDQVEFNLTSANMQTGYYTLGTKNSTDSPVQGLNTSGTTWYALASGDWTNPNIWTLDPAGILYNNPTSYYPQAENDKVFIGSGKTVNMDLPDPSYTFESVTVNGRLDLNNKSGLKFIDIKGSGRILMSADVFPEFSNADHFIKEGEGAGTVVVYGNSFSTNHDYEFYNLEVKMSSGQTFTVLKDLSLNGNLIIEEGEMKINNDVATTNLNINVDKNIDVFTGASLTTGTANARHQLNLKGNLINKGTVKFTNRTVADYFNEATDGIVDVNFINSNANQDVSCLGITNFYRITVEKGEDMTYILSIDADSPAYFKLLGTTKDNTGSNIPQYSSAYPMNNALSLYKGTLRLGDNITVSRLNNTGNYNLSTAACLWLDGGTVTKGPGTALVVYGKVRVTSGTLNVKTHSGLTIRNAGSIYVEGDGVLNTNQIRTSVYGTSHVGSYIQTGGTVNLADNAQTDYYRFCLTYPQNTFTMSGGVLNIIGTNGSTGNNGGIFINSTPENINVTGGTVNVKVADSRDVKITSKAPFYNLILSQIGTAQGKHIIDAGVDVGSTNVNLPAQPLVVLNNLTIEDHALLNHNGKNVIVGGNLSVPALPHPSGGLGILYDENFHNRLIFNGNKNSEFYMASTNAADYPFLLSSLEVNKEKGKEVLMSAAASLPTATNSTINVSDTTDINSGILNQGTQSVMLFGRIVKIGNDGELGVYNEANLTSYIMLRRNRHTEITSNNGTVGNLKLDKLYGNRIKLIGNLYAKRIGFHGGVMNLQSYKLTIDNLHKDATTNNLSPGDGSFRNVICSEGKASNGGIALKIKGNGTYTLPLGVIYQSNLLNPKYTPAVATITNFTDAGYLQIRPVDKELKTTNLNGGDLLDYYWRVSNSDINADVAYNFYYYDDYVVGDESNYVAGKVLDNSPYTRSHLTTSEVDETNNIISFTATPVENANYTAGAEARFTGSVRIFYTKKLDDAYNLEWTNTDAWTLAPNATYGKHDSRQPSAGTYPQAGDIAVIGWVPYDDTGYPAKQGYPHGINTKTTIEFAEIVFSQMKDAAGNPTERKYSYSYQFRPTICIDVNTDMQGDIISGEGLIWLHSTSTNQVDYDFSNIDIGGFVAQDSSYFLYENAHDHFVFKNIPRTLPNLLLMSNSWSNADVDFKIETGKLTINNNLAILGDINLILNTDISVGNNVTIFRQNINGNDSEGNGEIIFPNDRTKTLEIFGDLELKNHRAKIFVRDANTPQNIGNLIVHGNIYQDNNENVGLDLYTAENKDYIRLILKGKGDKNYTAVSGDKANLHSIIMDRGNEQSASFTFNNNFDLNGATNGTDKALKLQNGTLILNHDDIDINLSTGSDAFVIPASGALELRKGKANVTGNSGISLNGKILLSGGTLEMSGTNTSNGDNYIEYSTSGSATIEITDGTLNVGSQIRRGVKSTEGILHYKQSGGVLNVGINAASKNSRGIFEVTNASSFVHQAGEFNIVNDYRSNPSIASLYFNPATVELGDNTNINIGSVNTNTNRDNFSLYAGKTLQNLTINNASGVNPTLVLNSVPLNLNKNLNIASGATFDANGLNVNIKGDFVNEGDYIANENETVFNGSDDQNITGETTFYKLIKNTSNKLSLNSNITVDNLLNLLDGTFSHGDYNVTAKGNVHNQISTLSGVGSNGVILEGAENQTITGNGTYSKLTTNNGNGILVPTGNTISISESLNMNAGVFYIGKNLLILGENAQINQLAAFGENNMIQTNISFADAGIQKNYPTISSPSTFTYPIGSAGKYTPVTLDITNCDAGGYIRVIAADEMQPGIAEDSEAPDPEIVDKDNVLQYHWKLDANNMSNFTATATMKNTYSSDVKVTAPYTSADYITASLLDTAQGIWSKYSTADFKENIGELVFEFVNTDDLGIDGDYTAGVDNAIPNKIQAYITKNSGDWNDANTWDTYPVAGGAVPAGGPRGSSVYIQHEVTTPQGSHVSVYTTHILQNGIVNVGETFGHRLGTVDGTGELYLESGDLPAGRYEGFFAPDSGTIHFGGNKDYDILGEINNVNNLKISGTGERRLSNIDLTINGDLTIGTGSDNPEFINEYDNNLFIKKDIFFNSGSFDAGFGQDAVVNISGNQTQTLHGNFERISPVSTNAFNHFKMNNTGGLILDGNIEIDNKLILNSGVIFSSSSNTIKLSNELPNIVTGGDNNSHIDGPLFKKIKNGESFNFPVGNAGRYGPAYVQSLTAGLNYWEVQYYNDNPLNEGYNPDNFASPLTLVSDNEYWRIKSPNGTDQAQIGVSWNSQSGMPTDPSNSSDIHIAEWKNAQWEQVDDNNVVAGNTASGTVKSTVNTQFDEITNKGNIFTISTKSPIYDLIWTGAVSTEWDNPNNWSPNNVPVISSNVTIPNETNDPVIDDKAYCKDMDLQSGAIVTIEPKGALTLKGDLTMNGDITILSDAAGTGSLIDNGTITAGSGTFGTATVQRFLDGSDDRTFMYHYISAPLANVPHTLYSVAPWGGQNTNFYVYNESVNSPDILAGWDYAQAVAGNLVVSKGYAHAFDRDYTVNMQGGNFNTGDISINVSYTNNNNNTVDGWNLIGNPYPSAISVQDFLTANNSVIEGAAYFWDDDASEGANYQSSDYATWNLAGGISGIGSPASGGVKVPDGNISCGQGFFVKALTSAGAAGQNVTFTNSMRTAGNGQFFKSLKAGKDDAIRLRVSISNEAEQLFNEAMVVFTDRASDDYDNMYDARKNFGNSNIGFYSLLNDKPYAIQSFAKLNTRNALAKYIPMGYKTTKAGTFKFTALRYENLSNQYGVFLEDKLEGKVVELTEGQSYEFTTDAGTFDNRFVLTFSLRDEPANTPPVLRYKIADTDVDAGSNLEYAISKNTFHDIDLYDKLSYKVSLSDGSELPAWLSFDMASFGFLGTPADNDAGELLIKITATDTHGASVSDEFTLTVIKTAATAIDNVKQDGNKVMVYPNPVYDKLFVKTDLLTANTFIIIRDNQGRQVAKQTMTGNITELNMSEFSAGFYFVEIVNNTHREVYKIIVRK